MNEPTKFRYINILTRNNRNCGFILGAGITIFNCLNVKMNPEYIAARNDTYKSYEDRAIILKNLENKLAGWSLLKGIAYGYVPAVWVGKMIFDALHNQSNFTSHLIPASKYKQILDINNQDASACPFTKRPYTRPEIYLQCKYISFIIIPLCLK